MTLVASGTWESATDSNVIDLVWNGGWGDGTGTSTAALTAAFYVSLGTVNTGTFTKTKAELDALSIGTGSNRYVQVRASLAQTSRTNPQLDSFTISYLSDNTVPETNASSITMRKTNGGSTVSGGGWTNNLSPYFSWTAGSDSESGLSGYCLYLGTDNTATPASAKGLLGTGSSAPSTVTCPFYLNSNSIDFATSGYRGSTWISSATATYYLLARAVDIQGNVTSSSVSFSFKFDSTEPSNPSGLSAPNNTAPSSSTCNWTSAGVTSLSADAYTTQPTTNTLYLIAKDETGNVLYTDYASVDFTYTGSAPSVPKNLDIADISIKATSNWKLALSWEKPTDVGAGVKTYKVYRGTTDTTCTANFSNFSNIGSTAGTSYTDVSLSSQTYYYCVKACDSANNCSAVSSTVSKLPTGKYFVPANLISSPSATLITTRKATISWTTDRNSDSKISYGTKSGEYNPVEAALSTQETSHSVLLTNLNPGTIYYYKAKWTDEDGNTGVGEEKSFTTEPAPTVSGATVKNINLNGGILQFIVKGASKVKIYYGKAKNFGSLKEVVTGSEEGSHTSLLTGLDDGTKYYYKVNPVDSEGAEYEGTILEFETLPRPKISGVRIQQAINTANPALLVTWFSNTEISSIITYYPEDDPKKALDEVNVTPVSGEHKMILRGLMPTTPYNLIVRGRDLLGNEAESDVQKLTTATDTRPPVISSLKVEGSNIPPIPTTGGEMSSQLIISWDTDEPSTSQIEYGEGTGEVYPQKTGEDTNLTFNHLVVISGLTPSKVYHLKAISKDKADNQSKSLDYVTITPKATANALDLVITNLTEIFSFLRR